MSEAKFTKGEWFIEKEASYLDDSWALSVKRSDDNSVHHCFAAITVKMDYEESNQELEANAHLIECAPEMYELLEGARDELYMLIDEVNNHRMSSVTSVTETQPDLHDMETLHLIGKLLAKARGEQ